MWPKNNRYFKDGVFISKSLPEMRIQFSQAFKYIGKNTFILYQIAQVDRHHFVDVLSDGSVGRIIILHFESFLPGIDQIFNYRIPDPSNQSGPDFHYSPEKVRIGDQDYIHNTWFFDAHANIRENPEGELVRTAQLFNENGVNLPRELQMSRYVRVMDAERKSELILFYMEPLKQTGYKIADFVEGGRGEKVFEEMSAALTKRSGAVFSHVLTG